MLTPVQRFDMGTGIGNLDVILVEGKLRDIEFWGEQGTAACKGARQGCPHAQLVRPPRAAAVLPAAAAV